MPGCGAFSCENHLIHILADTFISLFGQNVFYVSGSDIVGADTFYVISCRRRSKLYDIGVMVEDGEHVRKSIQYPGTIFITKTSFGGRGRI